MSLRETLNNNPAIATGGAVVVLLLCLLLIVCQFTGGGGNSFDLIYYDVTDNKIELVKYRTGSGMIESPLPGTETYQASVFSCTECKEIKNGMTREELQSAGMFVGYLTKINLDAMENLIRPVDNDNWVNMESQEGQRFINDMMRKCPNNSAQPCVANS